MRLTKEIIQGAKNWALANKSDPFAFRTAISMALSGSSSVSNDEGKVAFFNAEPVIEIRRSSAENEYQVTGWKNIVRP